MNALPAVSERTFGSNHCDEIYMERMKIMKILYIEKSYRLPKELNANNKVVTISLTKV